MHDAIPITHTTGRRAAHWVLFFSNTGRRRNLIADGCLDWGTSKQASALTTEVRVQAPRSAEVLPSGDYGSALAAAAARGHSGPIEAAKFLIEKGANMNMILQRGEV